MQRKRLSRVAKDAFATWKVETKRCKQIKKASPRYPDNQG